MDRKIVMLLIGIVAIGMFALPSTLAMYTGQHNFSDGASVDCNKCHGGSDSVGTELANGDNHTTFSCKRCHGFGTGQNPNVDDGTMGHAATSQVTCTGCHVENITYGTDGLDPDGITVENELNNGSHKAFKDAPPGGDLDKACIACHTQVGVTGLIGVNGTSNANISIAGFNYSGV